MEQDDLPLPDDAPVTDDPGCTPALKIIRLVLGILVSIVILITNME